jgi:hypothetical protein
VQAAERRLLQFPMIAAGVMEREVIELRPFAAIEMLFS